MSRERSRSVHLAVVGIARPVMGPLPPKYGHGPDIDDPGSVSAWAYWINASWGILAVGCAIAMGVVGFSLGALFGEAARKAAVPFGIGAGFFCLAGSVAALWDRYVRRSLPSNRSLVFQAAVGLLAAYIAVVNL